MFRCLPLCLLALLPLLPLELRAQEVGELAPVDSSEIAALPIEVFVSKHRVAYKGDSIVQVITPTFYKYAPQTFRSARERERYNRLVQNVRKLLPLAKLARLTVIETYDYLQTLPDEASRRRHLQAVEEGLKRQYAPVVRRMSRSQGRLFVKLIDRECGQTGYSIAQAFIGSFKAGVYQGVAFVFGQSLTRRYDPEGEDRQVERVIRLMESGQL